MIIEGIEKIWYRGRVLKQSFQEYRLCLKDVYQRADSILKSPPYIPQEFNVKMGELPEEFFSLRKNIFSTLFQSIYHLLQIGKERRLLYGKFNHLFRIWVTSADNLLDLEDKVVIPIEIPGTSRVMRQVISLMAADRIMKQLLDEAQAKGFISQLDSRNLSDKSLQILLPSAAEEASEEGGISERPDPDYVLYTIHRLKTGLLFHIPFLGPETIENNINKKLLNKCKDALDKFGLGCQLLDDIRDMAKDHLEKRHNYILSKIYHQERISAIQHLGRLEGRIDPLSKIHPYFPEVVYPAAELAMNLLGEGLHILDEAGLGVGKQAIKLITLSMFKILDLGDLIECLNTKKTVETKP